MQMTTYTPGERMVLMSLRVGGSMTLDRLIRVSGYKTGNHVRSLVRSLVRGGMIQEEVNPAATGEADRYIYMVPEVPECHST